MLNWLENYTLKAVSTYTRHRLDHSYSTSGTYQPTVQYNFPPLLSCSHEGRVKWVTPTKRVVGSRQVTLLTAKRALFLEWFSPGSGCHTISSYLGDRELAWGNPRSSVVWRPLRSCERENILERAPYLHSALH